MPRFGLPPSDEPPTPMSPDDRAALTKWSWKAKVLAVIAGVGMVAAFVFEFLPPTSDNGSSQKISTTVVVTTTTTVLSTTTSSTPVTTTSVPATTTTTR